MPLLRGVARTAVIAGTATAVSNRVSRRQAGRWAQQDAAAQPQAAPEQQYQQPPQQYQQQYQQPPGRPDTDTKLAQLKQLGELKNAGVLTEAEFEAQKAQILNA